MSDSDGPGRREVAYRLFAAEFDDASYSYSEGEDERAPNYVVTPTGARVNRLFAVGVLTEVEQVSEDVLRGRVVDPTGAFVLYAGQYQPDEQAFLEQVETPTFVAVTGKARTFQPEDSDRVFTSVRPESLNEVSAETRDRWVVGAAEQTLERIEWAAVGLSVGLTGDALEEALLERGADSSLAAGVPVALDHYGTTPTYLDALRETALDAARVVAGERDEVDELTLPPDQPGDHTAADLVGSAPAGAAVTDEPPDAGADLGGDTTDDQPTEMESGPEQDGVASADVSTEDATEPDELGDFDPGEFDLEEETRQQIEEEYGTEFQTGSEVEEPGEADIETPDTPAGDGSAEPEPEPDPAVDAGSAEAAGAADPDESGETEAESGPEEADETEPDEAEAEPREAETDDEAEEAEEVEDVETAVVEVMTELDDGDGADREAVVEEMAARYGVGAEETTEAIQDALMAGRCYEPDDATLKPI